MNDYGIGLTVLVLVNVMVYLTQDTYTFFREDKFLTWYYNKPTLHLWLVWSADTSYLLFHWFFNMRYVKSTFRLPVLQKSAEFMNEMLDRILMQREEQSILFSQEELEDHITEMAKLKKRQVRQENWANVIEGAFLLMVAASGYTKSLSIEKTVSYFFLPMFLILNIVMLIAVVVMRFVIKRMPNLLPNESLVIVHVLLFTAVTSVWIVERAYFHFDNQARNAYYDEPTPENNLNWT